MHLQRARVRRFAGILPTATVALAVALLAPPASAGVTLEAPPRAAVKSTGQSDAASAVARPRTGFWYGEGAERQTPSSRWWISFRVVRRGGGTLVRDITASTHEQQCHIEVDPNARHNARGRINLGTLRVDRRGRFRDRPNGRPAFFARARFTRPGRVAGLIRWLDRSACEATGLGQNGLLRFRAARAGAPPLAVGRWSGVVAAQTVGAQQLPEQPLGFDVLPGGRFMRIGTIRLRVLAQCSTSPDVWEPSGIVIARPFGSIAGRRAIPPRRDFKLVEAPDLGDTLSWRIVSDGDSATGTAVAGSQGPASGCSSLLLPWTSVGPKAATSAARPAADRASIP